MGGMSSERAEPWCLHFTLANPKGPRRGDLPLLLRRVADEVERLGDIEVLDLVTRYELGPDLEYGWTASVYYTRYRGPSS
jgi:hypothetical protein